MADRVVDPFERQLARSLQTYADRVWDSRPPDVIAQEAWRARRAVGRGRRAWGLAAAAVALAAAALLGTIVASRPPWGSATGMLAVSLGGAISLLDPASWRAFPLTDGATFDTELTWSPDGRLLAFTRRREMPAQSELVVIDPVSRALRSVATGRQNEAFKAVWSPDSNHLAYAASGAVHIAGMTGGAPTVVGPPDTYPVAWAPDGRRLLLVRFNTPSSLVIATTTGQDVSPVIDLPGSITSCPTCWRADETIVYSTGYGVYEVRSDGTRNTFLGRGTAPDISRATGVILVRAETTRAEFLEDTGDGAILVGAWDSAWSPDGSEIAAWEPGRLVIRSLAGATRELLSWDRGDPATQVVSMDWQPR